MKQKLILFFLVLFEFTVFSQSISSVPEGMLILQKDIVIEPGNANGTTEYTASLSGNSPFMAQGVNLYIRKKPLVESIMLVETTKDPLGKEDNYSYRSLEYNSVNGDEIRYLNGKVLDSKYGKYGLISSTVTNHPLLGECFHIYIPPVVEYGYPWSRHGTVEIKKGMFINIRTFSKKYGDYSGEYADNPFMFDELDFVSPVKEAEVKSIPEKLTLTDDYNVTAALKFSEIATNGKGLLRYSKGPETITQDLLDAVENIDPKEKVDIVLAIDTTGSMKDDLRTMREKWIPKFVEQVKTFGDVRVGLLCYRDYGDFGGYNYKRLPVKFFQFTNDINTLVRNIRSIVIHGNEGGDVPEAVYEALFAAETFYEWRSDACKKIILIGDAEPHPTPRGLKEINQEHVMNLAVEKNIILDCIIVPDDKAKSRGR